MLSIGYFYRLMFAYSHFADPELKINFSMNLVLTSDATWVKIPQYLAMSNSARVFVAQIDPTGLPIGVHSTR